MYYLIYGSLYLFSLLPFFILYGISDLIYFLLYHVAGYRRKIVDDNLNIAFPEKTASEKSLIAKQFYRNLVDNFIETIKLLSIPEKSFVKRASVNFTDAQRLADAGLNIQFHSGHQMNWEYASLAISRSLTIPWLAIYMLVKPDFMERLFLKIRGRFGAVMIEKAKYQSMMPQLIKKQYALGLIADQNPGFAKNAYWLNFFNKPAPFIVGPEKGAMRNKTAVVFVNMIKVKRGYYHFDCKVITEDGSNFSSGQLTRNYRDNLEYEIRKHPDNYLWSHRRWKFDWDKAYEKRWVDTDPFPQTDAEITT